MSDLLTIADLVDDLTNPMNIREPYHVWHGNNRKTLHHRHTLPSLIDQLAQAKIPGEVYIEDDAGHVHRKPASTPPARIDAINLSLAIDVGAANWVWRCRMTVREQTTANLRQLVGAQVDSDRRDQIRLDLSRWTHAAKIVAGWERPPWRPAAPCPLCDQMGLRVRLDRSTAVCVECHETWDATTIGLLGGHVSAYTGRVRSTTPGTALA